MWTLVIKSHNFSSAVVPSVPGQRLLKVTSAAERRFESSKASQSSCMERFWLWGPSQVPGSSRLSQFVTKLSGGDVNFFRTLKRSGVSLVGWSLTRVVREEKSDMSTGAKPPVDTSWIFHTSICNSAVTVQVQLPAGGFTSGPSTQNSCYLPCRTVLLTN